MSMDDNDGQMLFGDLGGLKLPDICLTGEEKPRKNLTQETCPGIGDRVYQNMVRRLSTVLRSAECKCGMREAGGNASVPLTITFSITGTILT